MKGALGLRPVFHYREDRIRAHVQLCWLALLLIRVVENATGDTWRNIAHELDRMHLVTLATGDGQVAQRSTTHRRAEDHPRRARPARTAPVPRLHHPRPTDRPTPASPRAVVTRPPRRPGFTAGQPPFRPNVCPSSAEVESDHGRATRLRHPPDRRPPHGVALLRIGAPLLAGHGFPAACSPGSGGGSTVGESPQLVWMCSVHWLPSHHRSPENPPGSGNHPASGSTQDPVFASMSSASRSGRKRT